MSGEWKDVLEIGPRCHERFLYPDKVPELASLDISMAGVSRLEGRYRVGHRNPEYHTILYTTGGRGLLRSRHGSTDIEPDSIVFLPAGQPHLFEINGDFWSTTWFTLSPIRRWRALNRQITSTGYCDKAHVIRHLMYQLYYEEDQALRGAPLKQLEQYLSTTLTAPGTQHYRDNRIDLLFRDIEDQLHYPWTIEEMSSRVHYSAPHLHRLCRQAYGRSPVQQLIFLRMQRAGHLLAHTDWSMAQIASAVGYQDVFNFASRFKKSTGQTPGAYRKRSKPVKSK